MVQNFLESKMTVIPLSVGALGRDFSSHAIAVSKTAQVPFLYDNIRKQADSDVA